VTLDISPKPVTAMQDLTFTVTVSEGCSPVPTMIDLSMPGMVMGENRVSLKKIGENTFRGTGIIVRCPSGRKTWQASILMPKLGSVDFIFDVVY